MSHVTHVNESCHTYKWVVSHVWRSHVTHSNSNEWVMSYVCEYDITHTSMRHGAHLKSALVRLIESCLIYLCESCLIYLCDMTPSYIQNDMSHLFVWHDSFMYTTWHVSFICDVITNDIYIWMSHVSWGVRHESFRYTTSLCHILEWVLSHWFVRRDSFMCTASLSQYNMTFSCVRENTTF